MTSWIGRPLRGNELDDKARGAAPGQMSFARVAAVTSLVLAVAAASGTEPRCVLDMVKAQPNVWGLAFSPDGKTLALSDRDDNTIKLFDVATNKRYAVLKADGWRVSGGIVFTPDGKDLIADGSSIIVWDLATLKERRRIDHLGRTQDLCGPVLFTPDGKSVIGATVKQGVRIYDLETGKETKTLPGDEPPLLSKTCVLALSPDGKTLAVGTELGSLFLWDLEKGALRHKIPKDGEVYPGDGHPVFSMLAFSPDGKRLVSGASLGDTVLVWDPETGKNLDFLQVGFYLGGHLHCLAFSPDGKTLAMGGEHPVQLWDMAAGGFREDFWGRTDQAYAGELVVFSSDGKTLATGGNAPVALWDVPAGAPKEVKRDKNPPRIPFTDPHAIHP